MSFGSSCKTNAFTDPNQLSIARTLSQHQSAEIVARSTLQRLELSYKILHPHLTLLDESQPPPVLTTRASTLTDSATNDEAAPPPPMLQRNESLRQPAAEQIMNNIRQRIAYKRQQPSDAIYEEVEGDAPPTRVQIQLPAPPKTAEDGSFAAITTLGKCTEFVCVCCLPRLRKMALLLLPRLVSVFRQSVCVCLSVCMCSSSIRCHSVVSIQHWLFLSFAHTRRWHSVVVGSLWICGSALGRARGR